MSRKDVLDLATNLFEKTFLSVPDTTAFAPGRVNLLGEHTDYNGGVVFPMPLALGTGVAIRSVETSGMIEMVSASFDGVTSRSLNDAPNGSWTDYVIGPLRLLLASEDDAPGLQIAVASDLPVGSGLSSSAALEVAVIRATAALLGRHLSPVETALLARKAENEFVGMPCGIMDQYSVSVGTPGSAVFLDTRNLASEVVKLPDSHNFVVIHSGVTHKLTDDGYEKRVDQCNAASTALGAETLSDLRLDDLDRISRLPDPLDGRARHIVTENQRVYSAIDDLRCGDLDAFSKRMIESHISQRDDFDVSVPQVDALVTGALDAGADGARLTGGGFGGSIVAFVARPDVERFSAKITTNFPDAKILAIT